jgi:uroporphyrin-III C-methyltransferase / precorrin-2 dehydrogenase / sirohydrochlorin ferrochelatase
MSGAATDRTAASAAFFPVFLRLSGRRVLLVGAGPVGASKLQGLLDAGALVTVVAPEIVPEIEQAAANQASVSAAAAAPAPAITLEKRPFDVSDLDGVWYVVAAATPAVNRAVAQAAEERHLFVNAVDDPPNATAYLGGVLRRGGVTVAISTDGHAPALAGLLREGLDALLPQELAEWLDEARAVRKKWLADGVPMEERRPLLLKTLNEIYARRATARQAESEAESNTRKIESKTETEVHA